MFLNRNHNENFLNLLFQHVLSWNTCFIVKYNTCNTKILHIAISWPALTIKFHYSKIFISVMHSISVKSNSLNKSCWNYSNLMKSCFFVLMVRILAFPSLVLQIVILYTHLSALSVLKEYLILNMPWWVHWLHLVTLFQVKVTQKTGLQEHQKTQVGKERKNNSKVGFNRQHKMGKEFKYAFSMCSIFI